jgi:hypothetical protein
MSIYKNIKSLLQTYEKHESPSKNIIKYGSLLSIELGIISFGLLLFYLDMKQYIPLQKLP